MDQLLHLSLDGGQARALVAWTPGVVATMQDIQGTTPVCTAALGRLLTAGCLLSADLKTAGETLSLQIKGNGIAGDAFCLARPDGTVKGYIQYPLVELPLLDSGAQDVGWALGGDGRLTVVRSSGRGEPHVGQVDLRSGEVAEDVAYYLALSEQTPSMVAIGEWIDPHGVRAAGGVLVQPLPGCGEETLQKLERAAAMYVPFSSLMKHAKNAHDLAEPLREEMGVAELFAKPLSYRCDCNRDRLASVLVSLGREELQSMIEEQHGAQLTCHFCNTVYDFSQDELTGLLARAQEG